MANKPNQKRKIDPKAKRNFIIFGVLFALFLSAIVWGLFGSDSGVDVNKQNSSTNLSEAGRGALDRANVDRTDALTTIKDPSYQSQIKEAEAKKRDAAIKTPDDSYMRDVATYDWKSDARQESSYETRETDKVASNTERLLNEMEGDERVTGSKIDYEKMAENRAPARNGSKTQSANPTRLTQQQIKDIVQKKRAAAVSLLESLNSAPGSEINDYTADLEEERATVSAESNRELPVNSNESETGLVSQSNTGVTPGVLPGDRFIGYTMTAVNTDTTNWVEVEISAGPLKGAIVGLTLERVEGEVVFASKNITYNRNTSSFKSIALNPDVNLEPAFSTETNMRYLARFGAATAEEVLDTVTSFIGRQQSSSVSSEGYASQEVDFSKEEIAVAAGAAGGSQISKMIAEETSKLEPQVKVKAGHRVVLAVTEAQEISWLPEPYVIKSKN